MTTTTKAKRPTKRETEITEARAALLEWLQPGDTVHTILRHVSTSGMSRRISLIKIHEGDTISLDYQAAKLMDCRIADKGGIVASGCGMDMGFHLVYNLSRYLWPEGYDCAGEKRCHSNDHSNGDRNYKSHHHADGGYALSHRWL